MLVVNASNIEKGWSWISGQNTFGAEMKNISDDICLFAVQGPKAEDLIAELFGEHIRELRYFWFIEHGIEIPYSKQDLYIKEIPKP